MGRTRGIVSPVSASCTPPPTAAPAAAPAARETLQADLVVATGRTGRAAAWLPALGYAAAAEEQVKVQIKYLSRALRLRPGALGGKKQVIVGSSPGCPRAWGSSLSKVTAGSSRCSATTRRVEHHPLALRCQAGLEACDTRVPRPTADARYLALPDSAWGVQEAAPSSPPSPRPPSRSSPADDAAAGPDPSTLPGRNRRTARGPRVGLRFPSLRRLRAGR